MLLLTLWFVVCRCGVGASADEQAPLPTAVAATCAIGIAAIVPLDAGAGAWETGRAYAAVLASPRGPGAATGELWINTSGGAFDVSFRHRKVLSQSLKGDTDPIVFRLPPGAQLENAFVSRLRRNDMNGNAACAIFDPWTQAGKRNIPGYRLHQYVDPQHAEISAAQIIADPKTACTAPSVAARTLHLELPAIPPIAAQQGITGAVTILVRLDVHSDVIATKLIASPSALLDSSALTAASTSTLQTAIDECRPIPAAYVLRVEFNSSP